MKRLICALALLPAFSFADNANTPQKPSLFSNECNNPNASAERKKSCLLEEKQKEARQNFRDFQENNHMDKTF